LSAPTSVIPFGRAPIDAGTLGKKIRDGERPDRPQSADGFDGADCVWTIVTLCWDGNIELRLPFCQTSTLLSLLQTSHLDIRRNVSRPQQDLGQTFTPLSLLHRSHPDNRHDISRPQQDSGLLDERLWKSLINHANSLLL
jgi:hypothetical protein